MQKHSREPSSRAAIGRRGTAAYTMRAHTEASAGFLCLPHDPRTQITTTYTSFINSNTASSTRTQAIYTILPPPPLPAQRPDRQAVSRHRILSAYHIKLRRSQGAPTLPREQRARHHHSSGPDNGETPATPETDEAARQISWRHYTVQFQRLFRKATA
jgi:hypothetical protein